MKKITFTKLTGAGNDFILVDKKFNDGLTLSSEEIVKICDRRFGIGADGIIIIDDNPEYDFSMLYFNSDGSLGSLCGNGARCAIRYSEYSSRISDAHTNFFCNGEKFQGSIVDENEIRFELNPPKNIYLDGRILIDGVEIPYCYADTGSPHAVFFVDEFDKSDINSFNVFEIGRQIRYSDEFAPGGVNVNFIKIEDAGIKIRTYERGVEDETLACGTGSVAAAITTYLKGLVQSPVILQTWGGDFLSVSFNYSNGEFEELTLQGPAKIVFNGEILLSN
ncbi:MAG: diaminopimelate epimerase [Bacteroidota bacterium]